MTKADILKKEGLSEEEFYRLYPTEEIYLMKCGGGMKAQLGQQIPSPFEYGMALLMQGGGECIECDQAKDGKWIQGAIKHPGRCTPGSPNYDCPKGSPQWNLAQRFKHGDLHKKQVGGPIIPDGLQEHRDTKSSPAKSTIPGQTPNSFLDTRRNKLAEFLSKTAQPAHQQNIMQLAQDKFMSQFQQPGLPMAQNGYTNRDYRRDQKILGEDWNESMYNQNLGYFPPETPVPYVQPNYGVGPQYGQPSPQYAIGNMLPKSQQYGIGPGSQVQPTYPVNQLLKPIPPALAGDESIPEPQQEISIANLRNIVSPGTWQGGLPGEEYMANSNYTMGEMMEIEKSKSKPDTQTAGKKTNTGQTSNFDWMGLVNMINTGVLNMATLGEQRKEDAWRKSHRNMVENLAPIYQANRGNYLDGARFSGSNFRPNQTQYGMFGPIARDGGEFQLDQEVEMSPEEIKQFLANGGEIEYLL